MRRESVILLVFLGISFNAGSGSEMGIKGRKDVIELHKKLSGITRPSGMNGGYLKYSDFDSFLGEVLLDNWWSQKDDAASADAIAEYAKTCSPSLLDQAFSTFLAAIGHAGDEEKLTTEERMGYVLDALAEIIVEKRKELSEKYRRNVRPSKWENHKLESEVLIHSLNGYDREKQILIKLTESLRDCPRLKFRHFLHLLKHHIRDLVFVYGIKPSHIESVIRNSFRVILA